MSVKEGLGFGGRGGWGVIVMGIKPSLLPKFSQSLTAKDNEKQYKVADLGKKRGGGGRYAQEIKLISMGIKWNADKNK